MHGLDAQFLEGVFEAPVQQGVTEEAPENENANAEADIPAATRKCMHHTVLADSDKNTGNRAIKPNCWERTATTDILECVAHDRSMQDTSKTTQFELLQSVNMTDILKQLNDRMNVLQNEAQQIASHLHEHIMASS